MVAYLRVAGKDGGRELNESGLELLPRGTSGSTDHVRSLGVVGQEQVRLSSVGGGESESWTLRSVLTAEPSEKIRQPGAHLDS